MSDTSTPTNDTTPAAPPATSAPEMIERALRLVTIPGGRPDLDEMARAAAEEAQARNIPLMARIQPDLYFKGQGTGQHRYAPWPGVIWKMEFASAEDVVAFRVALEKFMLDYFGVTPADTPDGETGV